ncbi:MAG: hypothetical protein RL308_1301 [Bacteroidota bacterium]|jgi:hypothetical protein
MKTKFNIEDIVFLITDVDQKPRIVTGLIIRKNSIIYYLTCGIDETTHYDFEIVKEKNYLL